MGTKVKTEKLLNIKQEVLFEPNEYVEIEIDTNTDVHVKKEEDDMPFYFEVPPNRYPLVCTTRLENMCIMQLQLRRRKRKNIIEKIFLESKNAYNQIQLGYNIRCKCKKRKHEMSYLKLQNKLSVLSSNTKDLENDENDKKMKQPCIDISSDEEVLSHKIKRKKEESSDSILRDALMKDTIDDKELEVLEVVCQELISEVSAISATSNLTTLVRNLRRSLNLKIIDVMGLGSNVIIIIKNIYSHTTEIYITDMNNTIIEFVTVPNEDYSLIYKMFNVSNCEQKPTESLPQKFSYSLIQFSCCCWSKRRKEIKARFPMKFAKFLSIPHACSPECSCCCNEVKEPVGTNEQKLKAAKLDMNFNSYKLPLYGVISKTKKKNQVIEAALNFEKPKQTQQNYNVSNKRDPIQLSNIMSLHLKYIHSNKKIRNGIFIENYEFTGVGEKKEMVFHDLDVKGLAKTDKIVVCFKENTRNACCNDTLNRILKEVGEKYALNQYVLNYIDGIHKTINFKDSIVEKCLKCRHDDVYYYSNPIKINMIFMPVVEPIEHIRKAIVGQIVKPKGHILEQTKHMEEKSKTIQEMMEKLEGKFPNISFFINEAGLPVASLPMHYNCYPIEDLTILTQVLEFAQRKITGQQQIPARTDGHMKDLERSNRGGQPIIDSTCLESVSVSLQTSSKMPNVYDEPVAIRSNGTQSYDNCSIMIKCNKVSYIKSFESFIDESIRRHEQIVMPTILNVCSLSENYEIARQLNEVAAEATISNVCSLSENNEIAMQLNEVAAEPTISNVCSLSENNEIAIQLNEVPAEPTISNVCSLSENDEIARQLNEVAAEPTISNVCSLSENNEIAIQLTEVATDDDNMSITILDEDELIC